MRVSGRFFLHSYNISTYKLLRVRLIFFILLIRCELLTILTKEKAPEFFGGRHAYCPKPTTYTLNHAD